MTANPGQPNPNQTRSCPVENTVNGDLTPKRRRPVTENSQYAAFARRILRAYSRRVATGDVESLVHMISLSDECGNGSSKPSTVYGPLATPGRHRRPTRHHPPGRAAALGPLRYRNE